MMKVKILTSITQLLFLLNLHCCPSFARCDIKICEPSRFYNYHEKIVVKEVDSNTDFSSQPAYMREDIFIGERELFNNKKLYSSKLKHKFAHGPSIEYGLSLKRHALRLKFQIKA